MTIHVPIREQLSKVDPFITIGDIEYEFEELAIEIAPGVTAGMFSGKADIDIFADGGMDVDAIYLDVTEGKDLRVKLEPREHPQLWSAIERQLQRKAQGAVEEYIDSLGDA